MSFTRTAILVLALALVSTSTATLAKPNNGAYARSIEAQKKAQLDRFCSGIKNDLNHAESEADKVSGTKAAEKWSTLADRAWADAHAAGCSWAA